MRTIETKVYSFNELNEAVQQAVLNENRDFNTDYDWYEDVYFKHKNYLLSLGFEDTEINFSGFCSQGDGASFTGFVNPEKWIKANDANKKYKRIAKFFGSQIDHNAEITRFGHYYHERSTSYSMDADIYNCNQNNNFKNIYALLSELEADIQSHIIDLSKEIYNDLEKELEYLTSDEAIKDAFMNREIEFTENGKLI